MLMSPAPMQVPSASFVGMAPPPAGAMDPRLGQRTSIGPGTPRAGMRAPSLSASTLSRSLHAEPPTGMTAQRSNTPNPSENRVPSLSERSVHTAMMSPQASQRVGMLEVTGHSSQVRHPSLTRTTPPFNARNSVTGVKDPSSWRSGFDARARSPSQDGAQNSHHQPMQPKRTSTPLSARGSHTPSGELGARRVGDNNNNPGLFGQRSGSRNSLLQREQSSSPRRQHPDKSKDGSRANSLLRNPPQSSSSFSSERDNLRWAETLRLAQGTSAPRPRGQGSYTGPSIGPPLTAQPIQVPRMVSRVDNATVARGHSADRNRGPPSPLLSTRSELSGNPRPLFRCPSREDQFRTASVERGQARGTSVGQPRAMRLQSANVPVDRDRTPPPRACDSPQAAPPDEAMMTQWTPRAGGASRLASTPSRVTGRVKGWGPSREASPAGHQRREPAMVAARQATPIRSQNSQVGVETIEAKVATRHIPEARNDVLEVGAKVTLNDRQFEVLSPIGEGTFGVVWGARCHGGGMVAIKEIQCRSQQSLSEALYEGQILQALNSCLASDGEECGVGRIPSFYGCGTERFGEEWRVRLAMTWIPGESLNRFLVHVWTAKVSRY
eukprot:gnl/TRDRNA2_/TRDRNA2_83768_c0_seq3.p1 gnl/TRDRNA2_/TRDRNA2_83768_c0~~gnl/TRDRNA2_/TRDRNA2_83768_c0_seq3.p1  ORF type:complete len:609 (-),score=38.92 gnl/TRDRNA2_/TRDRNA2_83768_c0_seq3:242-2068(-)